MALPRFPQIIRGLPASVNDKMKKNRAKICHLIFDFQGPLRTVLYPAVRGLVPGLVALAFGLGYRGGLCTLHTQDGNGGKLRCVVQRFGKLLFRGAEM